MSSVVNNDLRVVIQFDSVIIGKCSFTRLRVNLPICFNGEFGGYLTEEVRVKSPKPSLPSPRLRQDQTGAGLFRRVHLSEN